MRDPNAIGIDLDAITHNMKVLRRIVGDDCRLCPAVKADAYGLGVVRVARTLVRAGADMLFVYTPTQAKELFGAGLDRPVIVGTPVREIERSGELYRGLVSGHLHFVLHDEMHLQDIIKISEQFAVTVPVHLAVDTGMCREGCPPAEAGRVLAAVAAHPRLRLAGLSTHFSKAENDAAFTAEQHERFLGVLETHRSLLAADTIVHVANTGATLRSPAYHHDMVRVGQGWAGFGPDIFEDGEPIPASEALRPVITMHSAIVQIKTVEAGATVGYGATWTARRQTRLGIVPIGYADGYPFALGGGRVDPPPPVAVCLEAAGGVVRGYANIVGNISMDQIAIDLTDLVGAGRGGGLAVGTRVELISPDRSAPNHLATLARAAGTTPYELMCRLNPRIPRLYDQTIPHVAIVKRQRKAGVG